MTMFSSSRGGSFRMGLLVLAILLVAHKMLRGQRPTAVLESGRLMEMQQDDFRSNNNNRTGNATVVSAFYPMNSKHALAKYQHWMSLFFALTDPMVIFTSAQGLPIIQQAMQEAGATTTNRIEVVQLELNQTQTARMLSTSAWQSQLEKDPEKHIHHTFELYWVWLAKSEFLQKAVASNPHHSNFFAWVDIGYFREPRWQGHKLLEHIPPQLAPDQLLLLDVAFKSATTPLAKPVPHSLTVGGGFMGGYIPAITRWNRLFYGVLQQRQQQGEFIGKDQPYMYLTCFLEDKACLLVRKGPDSFGDPWFFMAPYMILGENKSQAHTWVPSFEREGQPYDQVFEPFPTGM